MWSQPSLRAHTALSAVGRSRSRLKKSYLTLMRLEATTLLMSMLILRRRKTWHCFHCAPLSDYSNNSFGGSAKLSWLDREGVSVSNFVFKKSNFSSKSVTDLDIVRSEPYRWQSLNNLFGRSADTFNFSQTASLLHHLFRLFWH